MNRRHWLQVTTGGIAATVFTAATIADAIAADDKASENAAEKPDKNNNIKLLAEHNTLAVLDGVDFRLCRGLTSFCPKECGHSGEFANFTIKKYIKYKKHDQYGDPEQTSFMIQVSDYHKKPFGVTATLKTVKGLKAGDFVLLSWRHDYVTKDGSSSPDRPIVKLEPIDKDKAAALLAKK